MAAKVHPIDENPVSPAFGVVMTSKAAQEGNPASDFEALLKLEKEGEAIKEDLDNIKIATLQRMITRVTLKENDAERVCPFLYLTNSQIMNMQNPTTAAEKMGMLRKALGVDKYQSCMILMPCRYGTFYSNQFPYRAQGPDGGRFPTQRPPELSQQKQEQVDHQLLMLAKRILAVAMESKALVIGNENCDLMSAFARVSAPVMRTMDKSICPFGILLFARAPNFHCKATTPGSKASHFHAKCTSWQMSDDKIRTGLESKYGDDEAFWPQSDLPSGEYTVVMFESLEEDYLDFETGSRFRIEFTTALAQDKTTIALWTYGTPKMEEVMRAKEHSCSNGLPLLILDSRIERCHRDEHLKIRKVKTVVEAETEMVSMRDQLHKDGKADTYNASALAFLKSIVNKRMALEYGEDPDGSSAAQQQRLIWQAIDDKKAERDKANRPLAKSPIDEGMSDFEKDLIAATNVAMNYVGYEIEWECRALIERYREGMADIMTAVDWDDFAKKLRANWIKLRACCFHRYDSLRQFAMANDWCMLHDNKKPKHGGRFQLEIVTIPPPRVELEEAKTLFSEFTNADFEQDAAYKATQTEKQFAGDEHKWLAVWDILSSRNVKTGNIFDLPQVEKTMNSLFQMEYLPKTNMLQTLVLIRRAWVLHDVYSRQAWYYKHLAKLSYFLILIIGIATVVTTVGYGLIEKDANKDLQRVVLLSLALAATLITGLTSLVDPNRKWMFLRSGQMWIQQEIWKLRTRSGDYATAGNCNDVERRASELNANEGFAEFLETVQEKMLQDADLKNTSFYSIATSTDNIYTDKFSSGLVDMSNEIVAKKPPKPSQPPTPGWLTHGQYKGIPMVGMPGDNGHSPASPDEYIRYRLTPTLDFYQSRIPKYHRERKAIQVMLLATSVATAALASFELTNWTAIVAATAGAIAAWQEFTTLARKLERYSSSAHGLQNIIMNWQALQDNDKKNPQELEKLVTLTEEIIGSESSAWLSDAKLAKATAKAAKEDKDYNGAASKS